MKTKKDECIVDGYNSRPREMINQVLQDLQNKKIELDRETVNEILINTIKLMYVFNSHKYSEHLVDACLPFSVDNMEKIEEKSQEIMLDPEIEKTLLKSQSSTNNVNERIKRVKEIIGYFSFFECVKKLVNMRNVLAHRVLPPRFQNRCYIELLSDERLSNFTELVDESEIALMDEQTKQILSNVAYIGEINEILDKKFS